MGGEDAELFVGEASRRGVFALVGSGCAVRSRRLARMRASGLVASLRDEAVAGVVIVCPSTEGPCGSSTSVKRYGRATRRRWRRFPGQRRPRRHSAAMRAVATKSLVIWPRACWSEGCFFNHWRSDMAFPLATGGTTRRAVRKHRAPKGALRLIYAARGQLLCERRQKAPSAKRCIKTCSFMPSRHTENTSVRKHRAPKGALRRPQKGLARPSS